MVDCVSASNRDCVGMLLQRGIAAVIMNEYLSKELNNRVSDYRLLHCKRGHKECRSTLCACKIERVCHCNQNNIVRVTA